MKFKIKILVLGLAVLSLLFADEFLVKSFSKLENDLSARKYIKYDINGDACALIKVRTDIDAVINFDSNTGIPIAPELKAKGEYWVYVVEGERALKCVADGFIPKTIPLESAGKISKLTVYELRLSSKDLNIAKLPVIIISNPPDAEKWVDGKKMGTGQTYELALGRHNLFIRKNGYKSIDKAIMVSKKSVYFSNNKLDLIEQHKIEIITDPNGADVSLDNMRIGKSRCHAWRYSGSYELSITLPEYLDIREKVTLESTDIVKDYQLVKNSGFINLKVSPENAIITLNNKTYQAGRIELSPGDYDLSLSKSGYLLEKERINIELGKAIAKEYQLVKNVGMLEIEVHPADARIEIDRVEYNGDKLIELAPGIHNLHISKIRWDGISERIAVKLGEKQKKVYQLIQRNGAFDFKVTPLDARIVMKDSEDKTYKTWSGILYDKAVPVGDYTLECSFPGYKPSKFSITVEENKIVEKSITLEEGLPNQAICIEGAPDMILVEGGSFEMGSNNGDSDEKPIHSVTVSDFYMGKYEVTVAEFSEFIEAASYRTDSEKKGYSYIYDGSWERRNGVTWTCDVKGNRYAQVKDCDYPVIHVSWNDAIAYCEWLSNITGDSYRLPTEAEWEYAARGGNSSQGYTYSGSNTIGDVAWYSSNSTSKIHPAGEKQANELGLYDMSGNVWEWCWDWYWYGSYSSTSETNPEGPSSGSSRVLRGGSWFNLASCCRVAFRSDENPSCNSNDIGFRFTRSAR